jgi:hypothetical protein
VLKPTSIACVAPAVARQLADVPFALVAHLGGAGVAQVRVVRPDRHAHLAAVRGQVLFQRLQRLHHVAVPQVPGRHAAMEHGAVVLLGVAHQARVLLRVEQVVAVLARGGHQSAGAPVHLAQLLDHLVLAAGSMPKLAA